MENTKCGYLQTFTGSDTIHLSEEAARILDLPYPPVKTNSNLFFKQFHPKDVPALKKALSDISWAPGPKQLSLRRNLPPQPSSSIFHITLLAGPLEEGDRLIITATIEKKMAEEPVLHKQNFDPHLQEILVSNLPGLFWTVNRDLIFTQSMGAGLKVLGLKQNQVAGMNLFQFFQTDTIEHPAIAEHLKALQGHSTSFEYTHGNETFNVNLEPIQNGKDIVLGVIGLAINISSQKKDALIIKETQIEKENILDSLNELVVHQDTSHTILWANKAACDSVSQTREALIGRKCFEFWGNTHDRCTHCPVSEALSNNCSSEGSRVTPDGRSWYIKGYPIRSKENKLIGAVEVVMETTPKVKAERAYQESEERFRILSDASLDGIAITKENTLKIANRKLTEMIGTGMDELIGKQISDFIRLPDPHHSPGLEELTMQGTFAYLKNSGPNKWTPVEVQTHSMPYQGELLKVSVIRDLTESLRLGKIRRKDAERIHVLLELNQRSYTSLNDITDFALEKGIRLTDSSVGYIAFVNDAENILTMYSWSREAMKKCMIENKPQVYKLEETGLWGEALRQRKPIITNDYSSPNPLKKGLPEGHVPMIRHMNIPVMEDGKVVAIAGVGNKTERYTEEDVHQFSLLMDGMWEHIQRYRAKEELRMVFMLTPDLLCIANFEGYFVKISPTWSRTLGWAEEELLTRPLIEFVHPEDRESTLEATNRLISGKSAIVFDNRYICKNGEYRWISWNSIGDQNRRLIIAAARDITDRINAIEKLQASEIKFRNIVENSPMGMHFYQMQSEDLVLSGYNKSANNILSTDFETMVGRKMQDCIPEIARDDFVLKCRNACINNDPWHSEHLFYDNQQLTRALELFIFQTSPGEMALMFTDITSRIQSRDEILQAKNKAEESDRLKSAFLANMSHEIRTPMNSILGFSQLLAEEELPYDKRQNYIEIIQSGTEQLLTVINDIIDISKIDARQITLRQVDFPLNSMIFNLKETFEGEKSKKGKENIALKAECDLPNGMDTITSDPVRLQQIITNLLSNALKFTSEGFIRFGYHVQKENVLLFYVQDSGKGIALNKTQLIFERFRQEEESITRFYGGSGLGLSISKGLVELFGGKIWLESEPGKGSMFYFSIPYKMAENAAKKIHEPAKPYLVDWRGKHLLLAEDNDSNALFIKELLHDTHIRITHVPNGKDAVELMEKNDSSFDIILMDVQMPKMNGIEATQRIRKINSVVPVIAQTAYAFLEDRDKCLEAGCNHYISKPFRKKDIIAIMQLYL